jgi:hypothetical protein
MNQNKNNNIINEHFEKFTTHKKFKTLKYIINNFRIYYQQRPNIFDFFFWYDIFNKTNKINNIRSHSFNQYHHTYKTHCIYEYKIPQISILQSYTIPSPKKSKILRSNNFYFLFFMVNFVHCQKRFLHVMGSNIEWIIFENFQVYNIFFIKMSTFYMMQRIERCKQIT